MKEQIIDPNFLILLGNNHVFKKQMAQILRKILTACPERKTRAQSNSPILRLEQTVKTQRS